MYQSGLGPLCFKLNNPGRYLQSCHPGELGIEKTALIRVRPGVGSPIGPWQCRHAATGGGGLSGALRRGCRRSLYRRATGWELRAHRTRTAVCGAASGSGRPDRSIGRVEARGSAMPGVTANGNGFWKDSEEISKNRITTEDTIEKAEQYEDSKQILL